VTLQALARFIAVPCTVGLVMAIVVWAAAALVGYPGLAPWIDLAVAALVLVFAVALFTGAYLGRPSVTYLDDNYSPLISGAGGLRLVIFAVTLIVAAFVTAAVVA